MTTYTTTATGTDSSNNSVVLGTTANNDAGSAKNAVSDGFP